MKGNRSKRLAHVIQEEVSKILLFDLKEPQYKYITVTKVELSNDLRHAKIFASSFAENSPNPLPEKNLFGDKIDRNEALLALLETAKPTIRQILSKKLQLRYVPSLSFFYDDSIEYAANISKLIDSLKDEE